MDIRLGNGFDVHAFEAGKFVILGGIKIPHTFKLCGHSDADVVLHAITDAIFGALAEGDIGTHFPPDDDNWKDASSDIFLKYAQKLAKGRNFIIGNVDCTVICEKPKIKPHAELIKTNIQNILNLDKDRVSIKATTSEKLGFTGREEGIAALATVTLIST
jgi:2-C-methyl-D-erythritol 4-phosphate cytidylyltransferase/2-C-methyl-D-erythritol 2,4-cyclodiphosphate synthase